MGEAGVGGAPGEFFGEAAIFGVVVVGVICVEVWVAVCLTVLLGEGAVARVETRGAVLVTAS